MNSSNQRYESMGQNSNFYGDSATHVGPGQSRVSLNHDINFRLYISGFAKWGGSPPAPSPAELDGP